MSTATAKTTAETVKQLLAGAVGTAPVSVASTPLPQLNGVLLKHPDEDKPQVYLVINGYRRWIPTYETFKNLFLPDTDPDWIYKDPNVYVVPPGDNLSADARLAKANNADPIYLLTNGVKMWIPTGAIMDRNRFDRGKVLNVDPWVIGFVMNGPIIEGPHLP